MEETLTRSVELGYQVIDDYIRRSQRIAEELREGTYGPSALVRDARDVAERMVRGVSDAVGAWSELLELASRDGVAPEAGNGTETAAPATVPAPSRLRVCVDSKRPVEVAVDLDEALTDADLVVHALRATDAGQARLQAACAVESDGMPTVIVRIGAEQAACEYRGMLTDRASGRRVGVLTVVVR